MTIAEDLLQAAEAIERESNKAPGMIHLYCCTALKTNEAKDYFESLFREDGVKINRSSAYFSFGDDDLPNNEDNYRRVIALLLAREIYLSERRK